MSRPNARFYQHELEGRNGLNEIDETYDDLSTYYSDAYLDRMPKVPREISWNKNFADLSLISSPPQMMKVMTQSIPHPSVMSPKISSSEQINRMSNGQYPLKSKASQRINENEQHKKEMIPLCCCKNLYNKHPTLTLLLILGVFTCLVVAVAFIGILSINFVNKNTEPTNNQKGISLTEVDQNSASTNLWTFSTRYPTSMPTRKPTTQPSSITVSPSQKPSCLPSGKPTSYPSSEASNEPSSMPSYSPSNEPSSMPSYSPSNEPSITSSLKPSIFLSNEPSSFRSFTPTISFLPTVTSTVVPSIVPSSLPTDEPTLIPTKYPTTSPSSFPSFYPTGFPTLDFKFSMVLIRPTTEPSPRPTKIHSETPSQMFSLLPSKSPSALPSNVVSLNPTQNPSDLHSDSPTTQPSSFPTLLPSNNPTYIPSTIPTIKISDSPSITNSPTTPLPTLFPSQFPSLLPTSTISTFQNQIPTMKTVTDMLEFSSYTKDTNFQSIGIQSHFHTTTSSDTEVHVLSDQTRGYLVVAFHVAESDFNRVPRYLRNNWNNLDDFGPPTYKVGNAGKVDSRLNSEAFENDLYKEIKDVVRIVSLTNPNLRIFFTGHGRAGATATLLGSFLAARSDDLEITIMSSGSPKIGFDKFQTWLMRKRNLAIWRIVHKNDFIARLPDSSRAHFGHLIQLNDNGASAYYQQDGNCTLDFAGVPDTWKDGRSFDDHVFNQYGDYFRLRFGLPSITYYMTSFERGCGS